MFQQENRSRRNARSIAQLIASALALIHASATGQTAPTEGPDVQQAAQDLQPDVPDTKGTGPFPSLQEEVASLPQHVIYRPADLSKLANKKLGVLVWGNGGCADDGASARLHLLEIASHGYLAIANGTIQSGPGIRPAPPRAPRPDGQLPPPARSTGSSAHNAACVRIRTGRSSVRI